jgi:hypothetical protein
LSKTFLNARLRSGLPKDCWIKQREIYLVWRCEKEFVGTEFEGVTVHGSQREVGTEFIGGTLHTLLEGY